MKRIFALSLLVLHSLALYASPSLDVVHGSFLEEVSSDNTLLSDIEKSLIDIVSLAVQRSWNLLGKAIDEAVDSGVSETEIYEALIHLTPYAGIGVADEALGVFDSLGYSSDNPAADRLPYEERFNEGLELQVAVAGEGMRDIAALDPIPRINEYLITDCFGDYYTRSGLDAETREMLTLAILVNQGSENVILSHINGNLRMGQRIEKIEQIILQCLPFAGYPKTLLALSFITAASN